MYRRIIPSLVATALCFSTITPAFAAVTSTDDVLVTLKAFDPATICEGRTEKNLGRCIGDVIKRIGNLRNDFVQAERKERNTWLAEHSDLGIGTEYRIALQAYLESVRVKRAEFTRIQRELEKTFFDARKKILETNSSEAVTDTPVVTVEDMDSATARCAKQSNSRALRVCLRQQLRLLDPKTKLLNVSPAGSRTNK